VDVLMLDLDVGFIDSPMNIVRKLGTSKSDVFVQVSDDIDSSHASPSHPSTAAHCPTSRAPLRRKTLRS
jgi:hypothetical protein